MFEARFRKGEHTTENISWRIMRQLIFRSVSDCSGQGKPGPILGEGFILLVFEHLDVGDGGMYAGQSADRDGKYQLNHFGSVDIPSLR